MELLEKSIKEHTRREPMKTPRYPYSDISMERLSTCHPALQTVFLAAADHMDVSILEGHRSPAVQLIYFQEGRSKVKSGKHNKTPSEAVDAAPYPVYFPDTRTRKVTHIKDFARFYLLAGTVLTVARDLGVNIRWGGDWDKDGDVYDQTFDDLVHFELVEV